MATHKEEQDKKMTDHNEQLNLLRQDERMVNQNEQLGIMTQLIFNHADQLETLRNMVLGHEGILQELKESTQELKASNERQERLFDFLLRRDAS